MSYKIIRHSANGGSFIIDERVDSVIAVVTQSEGCKPLVELANRAAADAVEKSKQRTAAVSIAAREINLYNEPDAARSAQAVADVETRVAEKGAGQALLHYLYEAMRAAQSSHPRYSPLMLEIEEVLRRNGFER